MVHVTACLYQLVKDGPRIKGLAILENIGVSDVKTFIDDKGYPITAPDGGSVSMWQYWLTPIYGAISIPTED